MLRYQTLLLVIAIIFSGCTQDGEDPGAQFDVSQDAEGHLLILNRLNDPILYIYQIVNLLLKRLVQKKIF